MAYISGSSAIPYISNVAMLGGFISDTNGNLKNLPVVGADSVVAADATAGNALSADFASADASIFQALNYLNSQSGRTTTAGAGIAVATAGNSDAVSMDIEATGAQVLPAHTVAATSVLAGAASEGDTGKFNITSLSTFQASEGLAASAGQLTVDADGSSVAVTAGGKVEVKDLGISTGKIAAAAVTVAKIEDVAGGSLLVRDDAAAGVLSEFALTDAQIMIGDGAGMTAAVLSGDVTMVNTGAVTIADNAVSLAKMAGITRGSIISGDGSGNPQYLAKGAASTFLQSDGTDLAYVAMSGDATLSAGVLTIADNAVSLAKMAGITRGSIISGGTTGDPQYLAKGAASTFLQSDGTDLAYVAMSGDATLSAGVLTIADNAVSLAKMAGITRGSIISGGTTGDPQYLAKGAASTFLQSDGTDLAYVAMSGDATLTAGALTIANDAVTTVKIKDANVTNAKLAADVFTSDHDWTGVNTFDTSDLRIAGTQSSDGAKRQYSLKVEGDILIVTNEAAW